MAICEAASTRHAGISGGHRATDYFARVQFQHRCQIQLDAARAYVDDVAHPGLVGQGPTKLPGQHIVEYRHGAFDVGGVYKFAPLKGAQPIGSH